MRKRAGEGGTEEGKREGEKNPVMFIEYILSSNRGVNEGKEKVF